mgnify:CR=1 FL=1
MHAGASVPTHLEAVHGQAAARLLVAGLQVRDGAVVHVLLLLACGSQDGMGCLSHSKGRAEHRAQGFLEVAAGRCVGAAAAALLGLLHAPTHPWACSPRKCADTELRE